MKIYSKLNTSQQTIIADKVRYIPADDEILMKEERPFPDYVANENGEWIEDTKAKVEAEIAELKQKLADTDYIASKLAEGVATKEEYADVLAERQEWRQRINELQEQLNPVDDAVEEPIAEETEEHIVEEEPVVEKITEETVGEIKEAEK